MRHFYPHPLTGNDWHLFMALVMLHKLLPMFVNRKTIVLGTGMAFLLAQTLVHLFHVLLLSVFPFQMSSLLATALTMHNVIAICRMLAKWCYWTSNGLERLMALRLSGLRR